MKGVMIKLLGLLGVTLASLLAFSLSSPAFERRAVNPCEVKQPRREAPKDVKPGEFIPVLKPGDTLDMAVARGREVFDNFGCAACHPGGGAGHGPALRGAALHFPRVVDGQLETIGHMNNR